MSEVSLKGKFNLLESLKSAFGFLDALLFWFPQWTMVKEAILNGILIVELAAKYGADLVKRDTVVNAVFEKIRGFVPGWMHGFVIWVIGIAIDQAVDYLNRIYGKAWIEVILNGEGDS